MARQVDDPPAVQERRLVMGYDDYLLWNEAEGNHGEWVDGEVIVFEMPKPPHQELLLFLGALLGSFARLLGLGTVLVAPCEMRIRGKRSSREPDIMFVAAEHAARVTADRVEGPADLVIEFVSNDSVTRDRRDKFREYEAEGIPEYWVIESRPGKRRAEFYQLGANGRYQPVPLDAEGRYVSAVLPGFWLNPEWLWQDPLPEPMTVMATIAPQALGGVLRILGRDGSADGR